MLPVLLLPHHLFRVPCARSSPWCLSWRSRVVTGDPSHGARQEHPSPVPKPWAFLPWKPGAGLSHSVGVGRRPQNSLLWM